MNKKFLIIFSGFLFVGLAFVVFPIHAQNQEVISIGEVSNPGLLPDSPFYFLKGWVRGFKMFFTFDPLKKAELELRFANEDALAIRRLYDKGKYELAEKYCDEFRERFQRVIQRTERAKQKGKDVEVLIEKLKENHLRQQQVLATVLEKAPEQAKEGILKAIENSGVGLENAVKEIQGEHKAEQFREKLNLQIRNMDKETQLRIQKRLESKRRQSELEQIPDSGVKCPDGICDDYELKEGLCPEDCEGVEGWEEKEQSEGKEGIPEIQTSEDVPNYQKKEGLNNEEKQIVNRPEGEPFCGDGICDDEPYLFKPETPENCPQDCVATTREEDFKENYNNIMAEMKDIIPDVPEEEKQLDMNFFVTVYPTCYFDAGAGLANYMENLSYDEFIWYGRPLNFKYDTRWGSLRTGVGGGELIFESFYNLGYKAYVGRTEKNEFPALKRIHMTPEDFIFFDTKEEALDFVKRLISADIPVMINLQTGETWDYHIIKGYDKTHIFIPPYVSLETKEYLHPDEMPLFNQEAYEWKETQVLTYEEFFSLWEKTGSNFYWFVKDKERKTEQEIFDINKKDAKDAYDNVQEFIKTADFDSYTSDGDLIIATASASRYLTKKGYAELGEKYMELATSFNNMRAQSQRYTQIAEIYKEAEELW